MQVTEIPVDSGTIEIAVSEGQFQKAGELYTKVQDLTNFTSDLVWDGKKGGIKTPQGDGPHQVRFEALNREDFDAFQKSRRPEIEWVPLQRLIASKPRELHKGFTLYLGDCGNAYGWFEIPDFRALYYTWLNEMTLIIIAEVP